jgi:hypothetical protein
LEVGGAIADASSSWVSMRDTVLVKRRGVIALCAIEDFARGSSGVLADVPRCLAVWVLVSRHSKKQTQNFIAEPNNHVTRGPFSGGVISQRLGPES